MNRNHSLLQWSLLFAVFGTLLNGCQTSVNIQDPNLKAFTKVTLEFQS